MGSRKAWHPGLRFPAAHGGPLTHAGTNTYLIGQHSLGVVDPGPLDDAHFDALLAAIAGRPVTHIFVTHTHVDHSPLAQKLARLTGAATVAEGPHRPAAGLEAQRDMIRGADWAFQPDIILRDGEVLEQPEWAMRSVLTPGHAANHAAYALADTGILFSGDHVMGWSSTIVAPPDGSMADYMASLDKLLARDDSLYLPGHGGPIEAPIAFVRGLRGHRNSRSASVLKLVRAGHRSVGPITEALYSRIDTSLLSAARATVLAHLIELAQKGLISCSGLPVLDTEFTPT